MHENAIQCDLNPGRKGAVVFVVMAMLVVGIVMVGSATMRLDRPLLKPPIWSTPLGRHLIFVSLGIVAMATAYGFGRWWLNMRNTARLTTALVLWIGVVLALVAVWVSPWGMERNGAARWLVFPSPIGPLTVQPSEVAKVALVLMMAGILGRQIEYSLSFWRGFVPALAIAGVMASLVGIEDFGTAALLAGVTGFTLFASGCRLWHMLVALIPTSGGLLALILMEPYRIQRLTGFTNVLSDTDGAHYHAVQSLAAIVSGGWLGRGLGTGQQKFGFLPEAESDFIFSVICEEMGVLGAATVALLFLGFAYLGMRAAEHAATRAGRVLALAITGLITGQALIHMAVTTVSAPTKGIPLPFISAGGSALVSLGACVGLLLVVSGSPRAHDPHEDTFDRDACAIAEGGFLFQ